MSVYVPNPGFAREWLASADAVALVTHVAELIADVADPPYRTGNLESSIDVDAGVIEGVATGRVNAHDFKAHWWEFGTRRHGARPYLRPAAEQITGNPVQGGRR